MLLNHAHISYSNLTPDNAPRFLSLLAQAAVLASIPGPACHLETFGQPNGGGLETLVELEFSLAGVDGSLNSGFLYFSLEHARPARQTHRFLIHRDETADQDRSWVHEFPVDQLRVFAGTYAHDQRAGFLAVEAPLTSSMTVPRAAVALSSAATV